MVPEARQPPTLLPSNHIFHWTGRGQGRKKRHGEERERTSVGRVRDRKNKRERVLKVLEDDTGCKRQKERREGRVKGRDPSQTGWRAKLARHAWHANDGIHMDRPSLAPPSVSLLVTLTANKPSWTRALLTKHTRLLSYYPALLLTHSV